MGYFKNVIDTESKKEYYIKLKEFVDEEYKTKTIYPERKKGDYSIEKTINEINLKAEGKFFYNKPVLKKKRNLEVEYLVVKAPLKQENASLVAFDPHPKESSYKDLNIETKFELFYNT